MRSPELGSSEPGRQRGQSRAARYAYATHPARSCLFSGVACVCELPSRQGQRDTVVATDWMPNHNWPPTRIEPSPHGIKFPPPFPPFRSSLLYSSASRRSHLPSPPAATSPLHRDREVNTWRHEDPRAPRSRHRLRRRRGCAGYVQLLSSRRTAAYKSLNGGRGGSNAHV